MNDTESPKQVGMSPKRITLAALLKESMPEAIGGLIVAFIIMLLSMGLNLGSDRLLSWWRLPKIPSSIIVILGTLITIGVTLSAVFLITLNVYRQQTARKDLALKKLVERDKEFFGMVESDVSQLLQRGGK